MEIAAILVPLIRYLWKNRNKGDAGSDFVSANTCLAFAQSIRMRPDVQISRRLDQLVHSTSVLRRAAVLLAIKGVEALTSDSVTSDGRRSASAWSAGP